MIYLADINYDQNPTSKGFLVNLTIRVIMILTLVCLISPSDAWSNGLFEASVGLTSPTGSQLKPKQSIGGQALLGWGGKLPWMAPGSASYLYTSLDYDLLNQEGPAYLGSSEIERKQWTPSIGVKTFSALSDQLRLWWDVGFGLSFDTSRVVIQSLQIPITYQGESANLSIGVGLQYKLAAGLLLSMGYEHLFYLESKELSYPEKAFLTGTNSSLGGRGRLGVGIGFYL